MEFRVYRDDIKDIGLYKHVDLSCDAEMDDYIMEERKKNKLDKEEEEESHDMTPIDEFLNKELESIAMGQNSLKDIKFLLPFKNLKSINVRENFLKQDLIQDLLEFPLLEELDISRNFGGMLISKT